MFNINLMYAQVAMFCVFAVKFLQFFILLTGSQCREYILVFADSYMTGYGNNDLTLEDVGKECKLHFFALLGHLFYSRY